MKLYVIRHGIAEDIPKASDDSNRKLTKEGMDKMHKIGNGLKKLGVEFDLILTSPYIRAKESASIVAEETGYAGDKIAKTSHLEPFGKWKNIFALTKGLKSVAIFGHEPMFSDIVSSLISGGDANISMKKGAVALIELEEKKPQHAQLMWLIPPKVFNDLL